jgi:hypothetical protein
MSQKAYVSNVAIFHNKYIEALHFLFGTRSSNWTQMPKLLHQASALQGQLHQWCKALSTCMPVYLQQPLFKGCLSSTCHSNQCSLLSSRSTTMLWQQQQQQLHLVLVHTCNSQGDLSQGFQEVACHRSYQASPVWRFQLILSSRSCSFHGYFLFSHGLQI